MRQKCAACGAIGGSASWCAACGVDGAMFPVGASLEAPPPAPRMLGETGRETFWRARSELGAALGGRFAPDAVVLLAGAPGSGKTRVAIAAVLELGRSAVHLDAEMSEEQCRRYWEEAGADAETLARVPRIGAIGWAEALEEARALRPDVLLVDSLQRFAWSNRARGAFVRELRELRCLVLLISHVNAAGGLVGGTGPEHDGDATVWVSPRELSVAKCRWSRGGKFPRSEAEQDE